MFNTFVDYPSEDEEAADRPPDDGRAVPRRPPVLSAEESSTCRNCPRVPVADHVGPLRPCGCAADAGGQADVPDSSAVT